MDGSDQARVDLSGRYVPEVPTLHLLTNALLKDTVRVELGAFRGNSDALHEARDCGAGEDGLVSQR